MSFALFQTTLSSVCDPGFIWVASSMGRNLLSIGNLAVATQGPSLNNHSLPTVPHQRGWGLKAPSLVTVKRWQANLVQVCIENHSCRTSWVQRLSHPEDIFLLYISPSSGSSVLPIPSFFFFSHSLLSDVPWLLESRYRCIINALPSHSLHPLANSGLLH